MLNGTCFADKVWLIDGFSDYIFWISTCAFNTGNDQCVAAGRRMTSRSCEWRMCEARGCFDMYFEVFVKEEARIESVNALVLCRPDNAVKSTKERNPFTCPVNRLHGKIWCQQTSVDWLSFINLWRNFCGAIWSVFHKPPLQHTVFLAEAMYCNFTLLWGHQLHTYSFMFVWKRTVLGSQQISCRSFFFFFHLFYIWLKIDENFYLVWGNSFCLSKPWRSSEWCVCACVSEQLHVWLCSSGAGGCDEGVDMGLPLG